MERGNAEGCEASPPAEAERCFGELLGPTHLIDTLFERLTGILALGRTEAGIEPRQAIVQSFFGRPAIAVRSGLPAVVQSLGELFALGLGLLHAGFNGSRILSASRIPIRVAGL